MFLCHASRRSGGGESRVIQSWFGTSSICFMFQWLTTAFAERLFAVLSHCAVDKEPSRNQRVFEAQTPTDPRVHFEKVLRRRFSDSAR